MDAQAHIPVMLHEVIRALEPADGKIYVDGTFGRGGYTRAILEEANATVYGIDRDPEAIQSGEKMIREFSPRLKLLQGPFGAMDVLMAGALSNHSAGGVDGVALDLGVSSPQIDDANRGFSFQADGPLDMRMSRSGPSAADIVNTMDEHALADIIYHCGEERFSRRVAKRIIEARAEAPIHSTRQLADIVRRAVPRSADGIDPATRTFQALRIHVNDEFGELERGLRAAEVLLKPKGRLAVVSFHSLEDRIVKDFLRTRSGKSSGVSRYLPANDRVAPASFNLLARKALLPTPQETRANPRARSAKLRVAERTDAPPFQENAA